MNIEINCSQKNILILIIIMGCPGRKINMAAVSAKRSMVTLAMIEAAHFALIYVRRHKQVRVTKFL